MLYKKLAELYENLGSTTKRLEKIDILSKFLEHLSEEDRESLYLLEGNIYPEYEEKKIGISNQLAIKAISKATGTESKKSYPRMEKDRRFGRSCKKINPRKEAEDFTIPYTHCEESPRKFKKTS